MAKKKAKVPAVGQAERAKNKELQTKQLPPVARAERAKNKEIKTKPKVRMPIRPAVDKGTRTGRTRGEYGPNKSTEQDPNDRALIGSDRNRGKKIVRKPKSTGGSSGSSTKDTNKKGSTKGSKPKKNRTPKRKPVTAPPPTQVPTDTIVRTQLKGVPVTVTPFSSNIVEQERDIVYSFLTLSGTELFQYTNSRSIDGMFDNVSIISVLSSRRREYTPNTTIETMAPLIKNVWREGDILYVDVERATKGRRIIMDFYVGSNTSKIGSVDYV
jgi:hypothetical protein